MHRFLRLIPLLAAAAVPASATPAQAAFRCDASALSGSVLTAPALTPLKAGGDPCIAQRNASSLPAGLPVEAQVAAATASTPQSASAAAGVTSLTVKALPGLPVALPEVTIPAELQAVTVPLPPLLGLPAELTLDLRPAVQALIPTRGLPSVDLVRLDGVWATAAAACVDGRRALAGVSTVAGVEVLGQKVGTGALVDRTLTLLQASEIDPSDVDLSLVALPAPLSFADPVLGPVLRQAVQPVLDALPTVPLPAVPATVKVTPGEQSRSGDVLTQTAARVQVAIAGQSIADLRVGEAVAGADGVSCAAPAPPPTATDLALQCTSRRLVLVDVLERGGRVHLFGAADRRYVGRRVDLVYSRTGRVVARPVVAADGSFAATAPLPARAARRAGTARYRAVIGSERSLNLKLDRRMVVSDVTAANGKVTITGLVVRPLARPVAPIVVKRRVSCSRTEVVARVKPSSDGAFRVTVDAPPGAAAAVYRLSTRVRRTRSNPRTFPTYTLPRGVDLLK